MAETDERPRGDRPGAWHHVMNRGLARRPAFENRADIRFFLSLLARKVRQGQLELHAYAILTTHFHLLVRSPRGELSDAMMWIEAQYVRRFNRRRERDGSLSAGASPPGGSTRRRTGRRSCATSTTTRSARG